jgi:putative ABC transport system permease protein
MAIVVPQPDSGSGPPRPNDRGRLTERDGQAILREVSGVRAVAPQIRSSVQIVTPGRSATTQATGATPEYGAVSNITASEGRFLTQSDVGSAARVAVIGETVANKLFPETSPVGETIRINRVPFTVIGLLESKGSNLGNDNDDQIVVPITTLRQRLLTTATQGPDDVTLIFVGFEDEDALLAGQAEIKRLLRDRYRVAKGKISPFTVRTTTEIAETTGEVTQIFQAVLVAIASISLLVGGIGIMNIMLVSVTERTREIGLRMALGAKRSDIRNQFLVEAAVLCVIGGAIGLSLAILAASIFERVAEFPAPIGFDTAIMAVAFSAIIGLVFGGYPAIRASRLSPIEALRSE